MPSSSDVRHKWYVLVQGIMIAGTLAAFTIELAATSIFAMAIWLAFGPFFAGETVRWLARRVIRGSRGDDRDPIHDCPLIVQFAVAWLSGVLILYVASTVVWALGLFSMFFLLSITLLFVGIAVVRSLLAVRHEAGTFLAGVVDGIKESPFVPLVIVSSVGALMIVIRVFSPPPFQFGWDMFLHSYVSNLMEEQSLFYPLPSGFSNSFTVDPYTTSFHLVLTVVAFLGNGDVLLLFWIGPVFNLLIFATGIAFVARRLQFGTVLIIGAVVFGVAFQEWNKGSSLVYFAPASLITAFTPIVIGLQLGHTKLNRIWSVHFASLSIILLHFFLGATLVAIAYSIPVISRILRKTRIRPQALSIGLIALASLVILIPMVGWEAFNAAFRSVTNLLVPYESVFWRVRLGWKIEALTVVYYSLPLLGAGLGGVLLMETRKLVAGGGAHGNHRSSFLSFLLLGGLLVYFIELEQTSRFLFLVRPGLVLMASFFCLELAKGMHLKRHRLITTGIITLILLSASFPAMTFMNRQRWDGDTDGIATSFIDYEMEMGLWIGDNLPQDILLVSDPRSQSMLLPFAMRETLFGHEMSLEDQSFLRGALLSDSSENASGLIREIVESNGYHLNATYLVVSGRTLFWAQSNQIHIYRPKAITDPSMLEHLESPYFFMLHSIENKIFLYSLAPP